MKLDAVNLDALYLVKLIFGKYFCYFDSNHVAVLLQLQLYLDANRIPVHEGVKMFNFLSRNLCIFPRTIGTSLLSIFKARRPLRPERKKRPQVRGVGLGDQNVRLIVHIAQAFHVPLRLESSGVSGT